MNTREPHTALVSDLMDGRLRGADFHDALLLVTRDSKARSAWEAYHLLGDVLRTPELAPSPTERDFVLRLRARLEVETALSPPLGEAVLVASVPPPTGRRAGAANDQRFSWKWALGVVSLAAVTLLGWSMVERALDGDQATQLAKVQTPVGESVMLRDPRIDRLLLAHRQSGAGSALLMPSGFLRNATFELDAARVPPK